MGKILLVSLCFLSGLTGVFAQEVLLGATAANSPSGALYRIDPSTGAATLVAPLANGFNLYAVTGLAFDNVNGLLYGSTSNKSATGPRELVSIDPATGTVSVIGAFGTSLGNTMADLTFDIATATLYGTGAQDGNLYSINLTTGAATAVGSSGLVNPAGNGVAANSAGQIFGAPEHANGALIQFNKTNGSVTNVATLSGAPFPAGNIAAMAFNSSGTLYGVNTSDTTFATHLITINDVTGAVIDIGASVDFLDAIVFYSPTAVPEPTTTMLFGAGLTFLTIIGFRRFRSRRSTL